METIDSLCRVLENVIDPGVEFLRLRLDALEKDLRENGQGIDRLDARVDRLTGRMQEGFSRLDARIDTLGTSIDARVDHLTERMEEGFPVWMHVWTPSLPPFWICGKQSIPMPCLHGWKSWSGK